MSTEIPSLPRIKELRRPLRKEIGSRLEDLGLQFNIATSGTNGSGLYLRIHPKEGILIEDPETLVNRIKSEILPGPSYRGALVYVTYMQNPDPSDFS